MIDNYRLFVSIPGDLSGMGESSQDLKIEQSETNEINPWLLVRLTESWSVLSKLDTSRSHTLSSYTK